MVFGYILSPVRQGLTGSYLIFLTNAGGAMNKFKLFIPLPLTLLYKPRDY